MNRASGTLLLCVALLFAMGLVMVFNTTSAEVVSRDLDRSTAHALLKQMLYAVVGLGGAALVWWVGYEKILQKSGPLLLVGTLLLLLVFVPGIGQQINGAYRWISVLGYSFQPSELVKYLIPLYVISVFVKQALTLRSFLILLAKIAIPGTLILVEPDNGTVFIIFMALIALFLLAKVKWTYWVLPLLVLIGCGAIAASRMPHVQGRIQTYLHPERDLKGKGHQPHQAKIAAGSGRIFGKGIGESMQKLEYLPEARSDYIAAIFAEEFGFVGILSLILVYTVLALCGFYLASGVQRQAPFYVVSIFTFLICFQAFLNLGVVCGLLPSKGTNLPFFSQGGSSLLANMMAVCLIVNIAREKRCPNQLRK